MSMSDLEQAFQLIDRSGTGDFHGPKPESLIAHAEQTLGLVFPPTYRQFLSRFGCGGARGCELYGLIDDDFENSSVPDGIWLTLDERRTSQLPKSLILVSDTGDGGYYAIDVSQKTPEGDSPIVAWWSGAPSNASGNRRNVASGLSRFNLLATARGRDA